MAYRWVLKYLGQKGIGMLPPPVAHRLNSIMQRRFGGLREQLIRGFPRTLSMVAALEQFGTTIEGSSFVELGTGWDAASAITLLSLGAAKVYTYDRNRHLDNQLREKAIALISEGTTTTETLAVPFAPDFDGLAARCNVARFRADDLHYIAPSDARRTRLPSGSIDVYYSLAVLEHIPVAELKQLLAESFRVLRPGGFCYHFVQPTMHAAAFDAEALGIEYLRYSDFWWETLFASLISYENRLRAPEHVELLKQAGFEILSVWRTIDQASLDALPNFPISRRFERFSAADIATNYIWVVGVKPLLEASS